MKVISHRGYWKTPSEKNQEIAFSRSFDLGFGTETDVRDYEGNLLISHDMPHGGEITLDTLLDILTERTLCLALNIKADGLARELGRIMRARNIVDWFVFDMSVPDMRSYIDEGLPVYTRMSEVEKEPVWLDKSEGIWLDAFSGIWYDENFIEKLLNSGRKICVVSEDLHRRDYAGMWKMLKSFSSAENLMLCTDYPEDARKFFEITDD